MLEAFKVKLKASSSSKVLGMSYKPSVKFLIHHTDQGNANALTILRFMSNVATLWYTMPKPQNNSNRLKEKHFSQEFFCVAWY